MPDVWFKDLRRTLARAFPHLFLTGRGIANGLTNHFIRHLLKFYDGRYEQDSEFVTAMFSFKMLSAAMVQGYRLRASNPGILREMGELINGGHLRELLNEAKDSKERSSKLERLLERYFGVFAGKTPFSPLTMASARGKMRGTKLRMNTGSQFITGCPPEHEDPSVTRLGVMMNPNKASVMVDASTADACRFNHPECPMSSANWKMTALKPFLRSNPSARMVQADRSPGLVALFFENQIRMITENVLLCPLNGPSKRKRQRPRRGVCGKVSAVDCVVQLQSNRTQRLHYHIIARQHVSNVRLFELSTANPALTAKARCFLDSVSKCSLPPDVHDWWDAQKKIDFEHRFRSTSFAPLDPNLQYEGYRLQGAKKVAMFQHEHSQTCTKTYRGQYLCRLGLPRPVNVSNTAPKVTEMKHKANYSKEERGVLQYTDVGEDYARHISRRLLYQQGEFTRPPLTWPVLWIQHRTERDKLVSEHNPILAAELVTSHNNQVACSNAGAENVDEYAIKYVTPKNEYRNADSQFHFMCVAALDNMDKYPTKASDADTDPECRAARTFGQKVVNSVVGSTEYSLSLMCYACLGHDAYESSEDHAYYYPLSDVAEKNRCVHGASVVNKPPQNSGVAARLRSLSQRKEDVVPDGQRLRGEGTVYNFEARNEKGEKEKMVCFVTHSRLYGTRPLAFGKMLSWEMLCVAQVVPREQSQSRSEGGIFEFEDTSPLKNTHVMCLRQHQRTPVIAEHLPKYPGNRPEEGDPTPERLAAVAAWEKQMHEFALVIVPMFSPWTCSTDCEFPSNITGFTALITKLNHSAATLQDKGRGKLRDAG